MRTQLAKREHNEAKAALERSEKLFADGRRYRQAVERQRRRRLGNRNGNRS